jgi:MFS family permease
MWLAAFFLRIAIANVAEIETLMANMQSTGTTNPKQTRKATLSGWIGSALEYYDFFIYAQAAALIFPKLFFPSTDSRVAIAASLATYGVGYILRPIGAVVLGHWGDRHGRKNVLLVCMFLMGGSTMAVGLLPTYAQVGFLAPAILCFLRMIQGFAVAGELSGASSMILENAPFGRRGFFCSFALQGCQGGQILAAAIFLPLATYMPDDMFYSWGWRIPFLLSAFVLLAGYIIRREVRETPAFVAEGHEVSKAPVVESFRNNGKDIFRVLCMNLCNVIPVVTAIFGAAYAVQPAYGIHFDKNVYLWIPVLGNLAGVVVCPFIGALSDRIGRRIPIAVGAISSGLLSFTYLYAISVGNVMAAVVVSVLMWGVTYQGFNATYPSFWAELFPTRTRVTSIAVGQNIGTTMTALLPAIFAAIAPPGSTNIPFVIGSITFAITVIAAVAALSARETYRTALADLGNPEAEAISKIDYEHLRAVSSVSGK